MTHFCDDAPSSGQMEHIKGFQLTFIAVGGF
uniref:Uncharacterized protein n=1 Tax=Anguilla anguilla TaxID=7936 RepID=A0A0E9RZE5_ANGAN